MNLLRLACKHHTRAFGQAKARLVSAQGCSQVGHTETRWSTFRHRDAEGRVYAGAEFVAGVQLGGQAQPTVALPKVLTVSRALRGLQGESA